MSPVYSLSFQTMTGKLIAATFGRSAWELGFTPSLGASPTELTFEAEEGQDPAPQTLSLRDEEPYGSVLPVAAASDTPWIGATPGSGQAGGTVTVDVAVTVTAKDKGVGDYEGSVTVTASAGMPSSLKVPVHLHVSPKPLPDGGPDGGDDDEVLASGGACACRTAGGTGAPPALPPALWAGLAGLATVLRRRRRG
jgi:MYXO-CTERM domain-containing protein